MSGNNINLKFEHRSMPFIVGLGGSPKFAARIVAQDLITCPALDCSMRMNITNREPPAHSQ